MLPHTMKPVVSEKAEGTHQNCISAHGDSVRFSKDVCLNLQLPYLQDWCIHEGSVATFVEEVTHDAWSGEQKT